MVIIMAVVKCRRARSSLLLLSGSLSLSLSVSLLHSFFPPCFPDVVSSSSPRSFVLLRSVPPPGDLSQSPNCIRSTARLDIHDLSIYQWRERERVREGWLLLCEERMREIWDGESSTTTIRKKCKPMCGQLLNQSEKDVLTLYIYDYILLLEYIHKLTTLYSYFSTIQRQITHPTYLTTLDIWICCLVTLQIISK